MRFKSCSSGHHILWTIVIGSGMIVQATPTQSAAVGSNLGTQHGTFRGHSDIWLWLGLGSEWAMLGDKAKMVGRNHL